MPSTTIGKRVTESIDIYEHLNKVIIPDRATDHYYSIWYSNMEEKDTDFRMFDADLMCCQMDDNPTIEDNWYHVEDLEEEHSNILDTIEAVFGISFHESIWKEISQEQYLKDNPIV